ncbi:TolC family outer membrane protein [Klebsiella aerogenes]|nr:TolC family outer membrane protein [Klebsiella aerogenes]
MRLFQQQRIASVYRYSTIFLSLSVIFTANAEDFSFPPTNISTQRLNDSQQVIGYSEELINPQSHLSGPLDIGSAVKSAVNWHPAITQQVSKLQEQVQRVDVAKAKYYPQVSAGMNNGYSNSYSDSGYSPSLVVSVSQMLYDFGKVSSSVRAADAAVAQQQATVMLNIDQVAHDTASAVVQMQGYQKLVKIAQSQVDSLKQIGDLIRQRNDAGATSLSDVVQTDTRVEGAQATLIQYQAALERWKATLATYLGLGSITSVTDSVPQDMDAACAVSKIDYRTVPAVLAALAQATQAQAQLDNATAQMLPTISLEPQVTHYLNDNYANSAVLNKTQYSAWVKVEMPIYQGGALTASREAAQQILSAANAGIRNAQLDASQKLSASRDEALNLKQSIGIQRRQQQLGEQTRALYQDQYLQLGTRPLLDLLNVDQEIYQAQFSQVLTEAQLRTLELDCLFSTGKMRTVFALDNQSIQGVEIRP